MRASQPEARPNAPGLRSVGSRGFEDADAPVSVRPMFSIIPMPERCSNTRRYSTGSAADAERQSRRRDVLARGGSSPSSRNEMIVGNTLSRPRALCSAATAWALATSCACVGITPSGLPVVAEVYINSARSPGRGTGGGAAAPPHSPPHSRSSASACGSAVRCRTSERRHGPHRLAGTIGRRTGTPLDVPEVAAFALLQHAARLTGAVWAVEGGVMGGRTRR
jgi:hypothetical protein